MAFLERTTQLEELRNQLRRADVRNGRVILIGGEAGAGKSTLIHHFCAEAKGRAHMLVGGCDPLSTPRPLGPLVDMADDLGRDVEALLLTGAPSVTLFRATLQFLASSPSTVLLIIEDVHWADEATLDFLRYLARRLDDLPVMVIVSYRDDELGAGHPLRSALGELLRLPHVTRIDVPPLTPTAVTLLAEGTGIDPAVLYRQTGGNPFYVTEMLAADSDSELPDSVRDAVLARIGHLRPKARGVLDAAAVLGPKVDPALLIAILGATRDEVAQALDECLACGVMRVEEEAVAFRHDLVRESIMHAMSPVRRAALHAQVLYVLAAKTSPPADPARLAHHAESAGDVAAVLRYAPIAAQRAATLGAHREALAQYERALRFANSLQIAERADLLSAVSFEAYLAGRLPLAIESRQAAVDLRRSIGDRHGEGCDLRHLARLLSGTFEAARAERAAQESLAALESLEPDIELAMAYSTCSQLEALAGRSSEAIIWGEKAIALATALGAAEPLSHALNNVGFARLKMGDHRGQTELERSLHVAQSHGFEDHVARAYINLTSVALRTYEVDTAERYATEGAAYCAEHDLDQYRFYLLSQIALARFYRGQWEGAELLANQVLESFVGPLIRVGVVAMRGKLRARRGELALTNELDTGLDIAERSDQPIRIVPLRAARAEAAWLTGDNERALAEARSGLRAVVGRDEPALLGEIASWLRRIGGPCAVPDDLPAVPEPFTFELSGDWAAAAAAWEVRGCRYESALSLLASDEEEALRTALEVFTSLGARPGAELAGRKLRALGVRVLPRGPRPSTRAMPGNLTEREAEVLHLMTEGLRNIEIADRLFVSQHTVAHHVSAILAKFDARSRTEAVEIGRRLGIAHPANDSHAPSPI